MDIFKTLTFGVKFSKPKVKRETPKEVVIKDESEDEEFKPQIKRKKVSEEFLRCKQNEEINKIHKEHKIKVNN